MARHSDERPPEPASAPPGETQLIWIVWLTYGAFYFCRTNLSAALPGIQHETGLDKTDLGKVLLALKLAYAVGQFVNGQFSERISARTMLALGMFGSAGLNLLFGFGTGLYFFIFVWAMNGYAQSAGWTPCVRVIGNWIPVLRRGRAIGIVGTGYQVTAGLTYMVSGISVWWLGWRGAVWVPPVILAAAGLVMLVFLRESPEERDWRGELDASERISEPIGPGFLHTLRVTLSNPALWLLALSLGMLNACRYGFVDWGISHLVAIERAASQRDVIEDALADSELPAVQQRLSALLALDLADDKSQDEIEAVVEQGLLSAEEMSSDRGAVLKSAINYAVLPFGAVLGSFLTGVWTDRYFGGRRAPVICGLLVMLGLLTLAYDPLARVSLAATVVLLALIGFCIFGPQVLLVGTAPADLARDGTAAAAAGFVNCVGYFGAALAGDLLTGYLAEHYGWKVAIYAWAGWAFAAALLMALLWNARGHESRTEPVAARKAAPERFDCPRCGDTVSSQATICPFCGHRLEDDS